MIPESSVECSALASQNPARLYQRLRCYAAFGGVPVKSFLNNLPPARCFQKREQVRHTDAGASQIARPAGHLEANDGDGVEDVHADDPRFNVGSGTVLINLVEQEFGPCCKLLAGIAEE